MVDITKIIVAFLGVLSAVMSAFVIPWIKTKVSAAKWDQLLKIASTAVDAAEQLGLTGMIKSKYDEAYKQVKIALKAQGLTFDEETIKTAIEAVVLPFNITMPIDGVAPAQLMSGTLVEGPAAGVIAVEDIVRLSNAGVIMSTVSAAEGTDTKSEDEQLSMMDDDPAVNPVFDAERM